MQKIARHQFSRRQAYLITGIYAFFGAVWILLSDQALVFLFGPSESASWMQTGKGWFYVLATSLLLYGLLMRAFLKMESLEKARLKSARQLQDFFTASPAVCYELTEVTDGFLVAWVSPNIERVLGFSVAKVKSPGWWLEHVHPEDLPGALAHLDNLATDNRCSHEYRIRHAGGHYIWIYDELTVNGNEGGDDSHQRFVGAFTDISKLRESENRIDDLEQYDPLTRLLSRKSLTEKTSQAIEQAAKTGFGVALLSVDVDNFKKINESYGHVVGDLVIRQIAQRIRSRLRTGDSLGRFSGDKFFLLLEQLHERENAAMVAGELLRIMAEPIKLDGGREIYLSISIGISYYPEDSTQTDLLFRNADAALNLAKQKGRNRFCFYSQDLTSAAAKRLELEASLRHAIENQEFKVYYQPIVSLKTGGIVGAEALVRWQPAGKPLVSPGEFIPVAEETGLICAIGEWVLAEVVRQTRTWLDQGKQPGTIAVNLSVRQLELTDVAEIVERTIEEYKLPPKHLELELTESCLMESGLASLNLLQQLHELGCRIAIDDFGTGYSSLAYLKQFPIDKLKIDRSFIVDLEERKDTKIAQAIISLAKALDLVSQAEGVELESQLALLKALGCDTYQGFYKSKPVPADEFLQNFL